MAKYQTASAEITKRIQDKLSLRGLNDLEFIVLDNTKLKPDKDGFIGKIVKNQEIAVLSGAKEIVFIINELYFNELDEYQEVYLEKLINPIFYDSEKDKYEIYKPNEFLGLVKKYGVEQFEGLKLTISQIKNSQN